MFDYRVQIPRWMEEAGVTMKELGERLGVSNTAVWVKLTKNKYAQYAGIIQMCNALGYKERLVHKETPKAPDLGEIMQICEDQKISYEAVERILEIVGYEITYKKMW